MQVRLLIRDGACIVYTLFSDFPLDLICVLQTKYRAKEPVLVTRVKECVIAPTEFLNAELDALLRRLVQVDVSKWQALHELGLARAASGKGGGVA
jgi:hypothetical protein